MAVRIDEFYGKHLRKVIIATTAMITAVNLTLAILFILLGIPILETLLFIILPVILMQTFALIIIIRYALEPLEMITRSIAYLSPHPTSVTPPHFNYPRYEKSGLKLILQTLFNRQSSQPDSNDNTSKTLLDRLPCGVILLDKNGSIIQSNAAAPVQTDSNNQSYVSLQFNESFTLDSWLKQAAENKVTDDHFWQRVQDRLPGEENRKIYDVMAHYEKNGHDGIETILITLNQTGRYGDDEESVDFLSIAAHELRGPITVIRGYMDVLRSELDTLLQPDQRELIERLDVSAARLSGYVNNILNVAKYDRKHLKLHLREDQIQAIYKSVADDLALRARTQLRTLSINLPVDLPTVAADRNSLSEVIANLVDNAIKYSREGGQVEIFAQPEGNYVRFSVRDHGIGIPASVAGNLFQKFYRSHRSQSTVSGTGLGLFISRAIVESHGGTISASSTEHEGSTFSFTVPIYATVADKLAAGNHGNEGIIQTSSGWIRNHSKIGG